MRQRDVSNCLPCINFAILLWENTVLSVKNYKHTHALEYLVTRSGRRSRWRRWQKCRSLIDCPFRIQGRAKLRGGLLPYTTEQVLVLSLPRFGQCVYIPLTCCRAWRFVLRRMGEFTARRMARLLHLIVDSLAPFCMTTFSRACGTPCAWEAVSHRYLPRIWIICIINVDLPS